jgi:ectoine hydroxylase-related dioxygenase (phytanoyl-CoA dioxygenase family)
MREELERSGYVVLADFMSPDLLAALRARVEELFCEQGEAAGAEFRAEPQTRRLANLVNQGEIFERLVMTPEILALVSLVLGPDFKLSSLNARSANPHSDWIQPLHCDVGAVPDERGYWVCNVVWMLDDFTADNGALRLIPGSHHFGRLPQEELADPVAPHSDETLVLGRAGTVVVMNAHLWHGGTANRTASPRRALHSFYCRRDKPQQQYQKALISPEAQARFSPPLRDLLALDDPLNDRLSATGSGRSGFLTDPRPPRA